MARITIIIMLLLASLSSKAQEKKSNCIELEVAATTTIDDVVQHYAAQGIFPHHTTQYTYISEPIQLKPMYDIRLRIALITTDNQTILRCFAVMHHKTLDTSEVDYRGQKGSPSLTSFFAFNKLILSYEHIRYTYKTIQKSYKP